LLVGHLSRCPVEGKPHRKDGAYLFFDDGLPAGGFENHTDGLGWENWHANIGRALSATELEAHRERVEAARRAHAEDTAKRYATAATTARALLNASRPAHVDHPYLVRKQIADAASLREVTTADVERIVGYVPQSNGQRLEGRILVVPVAVGAELSTVEFIDERGKKSALKGGRKADGYWEAQPLPAGGGTDMTILIGEGVATVLSAVAATGHQGLAALSCDNLPSVAESIRKRYPEAKIVLLADIGIGEAKATEAARRVGGVVAVPSFGVTPPAGADFNDLKCAHDAGAVRAQIEAATARSVDAAQDSQARRPATIYPYGGGRFRVEEDGIWYDPPQNDNGGDTQSPIWIASRIDVVAMSRNNQGEDWGRQLEWFDADGRKHQWPMPVELLAGDGTEIRRELLRGGVQIGSSRSARERLAAFLTVAQPAARVICVDRVGWFGSVFVRPDRVFGVGTETVRYQSTSAIQSTFSSKGYIEDWRDGVCALAAENSRLVLAICAALAGPLLSLVGQDGGGFHFRGASSSGKSTALLVAASVYGAPGEFVRSWRSTTNGLEAVAALHNDTLLVLDELGQMNPNEAGQAAYLIGNGQGKARASAAGTAKRSARWRILTLSAGEQSLASLSAEAGKRIHAGQELRLADIDADAGAGMGIIEALNGYKTSGELVDALRSAVGQFYGSVGATWLDWLAKDRSKIVERLTDQVAEAASEFLPSGTSGQAARVAQRFGLVATAGEMATFYGLTGWPQGHATECVRRCFEAWLDGFGGGAGQKEDAEILSHVRRFIEAHGNSRFQAWDSPDQRVVDRVGFVRGIDAERKFYFLPETFKRELCAGRDAKSVVRVLKAVGVLELAGDGACQQKPRLPGLGPTRCYVLLAAKLFGDQP
jgi:uncharacterized protein (DUF927 family)/phage/plasmid primase-like uncharacterized protein